MTEPKRPGLDEAIEAAADAVARLWARSNESGTVPSDRAEAEEIIEVAYPIIAAAVRADERAEWETRLDKVRALLDEADRWHVYAPRELGDAYAADTVLDFLADIRAALTEPTP